MLEVFRILDFGLRGFWGGVHTLQGTWESAVNSETEIGLK